MSARADDMVGDLLARALPEAVARLRDSSADLSRHAPRLGPPVARTADARLTLSATDQRRHFGDGFATQPYLKKSDYVSESMC